MCSHYQAIKGRERYASHFAVQLPDDLGRHDLWPGYMGTFVRRHQNPHVGQGAQPQREVLSGLFGLVPPWSPDTKIARLTYNARCETAASKPSFRQAWAAAQHCIIPAEAIFEPDWRSGRPVPTQIALATGEPLGLAGLWSRWQSAQGEVVHSYTLLTINAATHGLMRHFHKPHDEKRMVVILPVAQFDAWLNASPGQSRVFMQPYPAGALVATAPEQPRGLF